MAVADPVFARIELVGPVPRELRHPVPLRPPQVHLARWLITIVLLFLIGLDPVRAALALILSMVPDGSPFYLPRAISAGIVTALVVVAHLLFLSRARRERQREPDAD